MFLERVRHDYEQHRQPETLREASEYMKKLTSGKYTRIWTPLAHDILFVDTAEGQPLPVNVLSRGTREQLFVSLRLALVSAYARRGIHLPMILDDVFVNFDAGRTKTACAVLRDFAKQGHQLLVFTCHEHVWRLFGDLKVDIRRIPNRHGDAEEPEPIIEQRQPEPIPEPVAIEQEPIATPAPIAPSPPPASVAETEPVIVETPFLVEDVEVVEEPAVAEPAPSELSEVEYRWDEVASLDFTREACDESSYDDWLNTATRW
jgi:hypothetical protein